MLGLALSPYEDFTSLVYFKFNWCLIWLGLRSSALRILVVCRVNCSCRCFFHRINGRRNLLLFLGSGISLVCISNLDLFLVLVLSCVLVLSSCGSVGWDRICWDGDRVGIGIGVGVGGSLIWYCCGVWSCWDWCCWWWY